MKFFDQTKGLFSLMDPMQSSHVKLLAFDFLSIAQKPSFSTSSASSDYSSFHRKGRTISRAETLGVVVSREQKGGKFLKFLIDDGTGCIPCILWLNHHDSPYFFRRNPSDVQIMAKMANDQAAETQLGVLARVRGKITAYRGALQITVSDVVVERDPNAEILHWLHCVKLARKCYSVGVKTLPSEMCKQQDQQRK